MSHAPKHGKKGCCLFYTILISWTEINFIKSLKQGSSNLSPEGRSAATLIKFTSLWFNDLEDSGVFD